MAQSTSKIKFPDGFLYLAGALFAFLLICYLWSSAGTSITNRFNPNTGNSGAKTTVHEIPAANLRYDRVVMVTGSQPEQCKNPTADHFLLRLFKNKVDYCRIHFDYEGFADNQVLRKYGFVHLDSSTPFDYPYKGE